MRRAARIDGNHATIRDTLRSCGCSVQSLAAVGGGCPDLLVGLRGRNFLLEIKCPSQPARSRRLRTTQEAWHVCWRGQVAIVETAAEALAAVGVEVQ